MKILLLLLGMFVIAATAIPYLRKPQWWIRGFDFPRLQFAIAGSLVLAAYGPLVETPGDAIFAGLLLLAVILQVFQIVPFTPLYKKQVLSSDERPSAVTVSFLIANVLMSNRRSRDLLQIIEDENPDIVLTLETDRWWDEELAPLEARFAESIKCPMDNRYGMHLYSKPQIKDTEVRFLVENDVPSIHATVVLNDDCEFRLHCLHPAPPSPTENEQSVERDAELLIVGKEVSRRDDPVVVTGDLNDVAWSPTTKLFRRVSGLLDPRVGRGMHNTFHAKYWFMRWPLDHLFHSSDFTLSSMRRLAYFGSDHFPILVRLQHCTDASERQDAPEASAEEAERAEQRIEAASDGA